MALGAGVLAPNVLAACSGKVAKQAEQKAPEAPRLIFRPTDAAGDVLPIDPVSIEVGNGWFQRVVLKNPSGKVIAGAYNQERTVYTVTEPLGYDTTYTWSGAAVGHDGKAIPVGGKFTTVTPDKQIDGGFQLADGQIVGIAAPVIIQFDAPITDKATVERALHVTTNRRWRGVGPGCPMRPRALGCTGARASTTPRAPRSASTPSSMGCRSATAPTVPKT